MLQQWSDSWRSSQAISLQLTQQSSSGVILSQLKQLDSDIDCIIVCGKQNISLRGHSDGDSSSHSATNKGNFEAVLEIRTLCNPVLQQHLEHGQKNAQYTSPRTTENEIIAICKLMIVRKIAEKVRENELYSIICDECTDVSNKEQLSL